jgi:nitrogen fixation/metabolism regulation signal transduction histidine kinase
MGSEARFALAVAIRAAVIGALVFAALYVAQARHLYAVAIIILGLAALVAAELVRIAGRADRLMETFIDGLLSEGVERPAPPLGGTRRAGQAIERALSRLTRSRLERQGRIDYLQTLTDTVAAVLVVVDEAGRVEWDNRAARRARGAQAHDLAALCGGDAAAARTLAALRPGERRIIDLPDGARLASVSGLRLANGDARRLIALQRLSGDLDAVEIKAWQDLSQILSHEMMNSLTPICSLAESGARLVREGGHGEEAADALDVIARRAEGLMSFVDRYRRFAELPAPVQAKVAGAALVKRIDTLMGADAKARGVAYASRVEPPGLTLHGDPDLLEQAIINLLKNALDAANGSAPGVALILRGDASETVIAVEDNGPGLAPADLEAAFVPFFSRKAGGSGIGLSLVRQIALGHGGRVDYAARPGGGAVFSMVLPL